MTANKPNVKRYDDMGCPEEICRVDTMYESDDGDYVLYEDYEALQAECEELRKDAERYRQMRAQLDQAPVGFVSQDFLDGKWSLDHIAKSDEGQISRVIPVFTRAQPPAAELEALRKDAERYRWLRDGDDYELPPFAKTVLKKLRRVYECFSDAQDADIGRHWLDVLTHLGLLNQVQRNPALWEISQQGDDLLTAKAQPAQEGE